MLKEVFAISDIHGMYEAFDKLLQYWNPTTHKLVLLGDYIDRGPQSLQVIERIIKLKETYPDDVVVLRGNHDDMFLDYIQNPSGEMASVFLEYGGIQTLTSFYGEEFFIESAFIEKSKKDMVLEKMHIVDFLMKQTQLFYEHGPYLFAHAGVQTLYEDWRKTQEHEYLWIRGCWRNKNDTNKIIVFGHTPTYQIHRKENKKKYNYFPYISSCATYIGIDGAACFGGQLNGVTFNLVGMIDTVYAVSTAIEESVNY